MAAHSVAEYTPLNWEQTAPGGRYLIRFPPTFWLRAFHSNIVGHRGSPGSVLHEPVGVFSDPTIAVPLEELCWSD